MTENATSPVFIVTGASRGIGHAIVQELLARVVAFLALPDSAYVTGQLIAVDGGYLAQGL